VELCVPIASIA
jgi:hypothetical protein